ncbi:MAG: hypothetical protein K0U93_12865 [Gammaproteobacteria bacterium]|nr:hypothetical protein [Gammaproteobacteria bacterium]
MSQSYDLSAFEEVAIAALLDARYEDGFVDVQTRDDRRLRKKAVLLGLINSDGFITEAGQSYWQRWEGQRRIAGSIWG